MTSINPLVLACGLICVWPLILGVVGFWLGKNAGRLRSPLRPAAPPSAAEKAGFRLPRSERP